MFIVLVVFLHYGLIHCQSNDTVSFWSAISSDGYSNYFVVIGDPAEYLRSNDVPHEYETTRDNVNVQWIAPSKMTTFPNVAYDFGRDLIAISQTNPKSINIDQLSLALSRTGYTYKYFLDNVPLSNSIPGLAFATNFNLLYWVDAMFQYIGVVELSNYQWTKIVDTNLDMPHSIAVHEAKGFIFWIDVGLRPKIERSNLIGEERTVIVDSITNRATHLVIEKKLEKLFWIDGDLKSGDFYGNNIVTYKTSDGNANILTSFVLYKDIVIFGCKSGTFLAYKLSQNSSNKLDYFTKYKIENSDDVVSGSLDSKEFMTIVPNSCDSNPHCDHLCLPRNLTKSICLCSFGFHLDPDGRTCNTGNVKDGQLLVSDIGQGMLFQVDPVSGNVEAILKLYPDYMENMAYLELANESYIYYTGQTGKEILRYQISKGITSVFYRSDTIITVLTLCPTNGAIYYSTGNGEIHEAISTTDVRSFFSKENQIIGNLYVDPDKRRLFYSECRTKSLVEVSLDSYLETSRVSIGVCATSMVFDFQEGYGYFGDKNNRSLIRYDLNKRMTQLLLTRPGNISGLTMDTDFLYVVDYSNSVTKVNRRSLYVITLTRPVFVSAKEILFINYKPVGKQDSPASLPQVIVGTTVAGVVAVVIVVVVVVVVVVTKSLKKKEIPSTDSEIYDEITEPHNDNNYDEIGSIPIYIDPVISVVLEGETESPSQSSFDEPS